MKKIVVLLVVIAGLGLAFFYINTRQPAVIAETALTQNPEPLSQPLTDALNRQERDMTATEAGAIGKQEVVADDQVLYDTKSDPAIQAIDPEHDTANEIKN